MKRKVESKGNYLVIDGDYYVPSLPVEDGSFETGEWKWRKVNFKKTSRIINRIADKLKCELSPKLVIADALRAVDEETLKRIDKKLKQKTAPKIKTEKHCVRMDIGGVKLPIR
jgi:hypothetical protein